MAFAAQNAHLVEHVIATVLSIILILAYLRSHVASFTIWLGYVLPF